MVGRGACTDVRLPACAAEKRRELTKAKAAKREGSFNNGWRGLVLLLPISLGLHSHSSASVLLNTWHDIHAPPWPLSVAFTQYENCRFSRRVTVFRFIRVFVCKFAYLCLPVFLSVYMPVCLPACLPACMSVSICLPACMRARLLCGTPAYAGGEAEEKGLRQAGADALLNALLAGGKPMCVAVCMLNTLAIPADHCTICPRWRPV